MKIIMDVFPAHLVVAAAGKFDDVSSLKSSPPTEGAHYVATTRVIITEEVIVVAADSPTGPAIIFRERYVELEKADHVTNDTRLVTVSGKMLVFKKDTNCGCGSRLRGWNAYKTINSMKDPE
jgi:hypothetical protein